MTNENVSLVREPITGFYPTPVLSHKGWLRVIATLRKNGTVIDTRYADNIAAQIEQRICENEERAARRA